MPKHWVYMNGSSGCMPDDLGVSETKGEAIDALVLTFDDSEHGLPPRFRRDLAESEHYSFDFLAGNEKACHIWGADYASIESCDCATPWEHEAL